MNDLDLGLVAMFGFLGYILLKLDCEPAPFLMGFILGPLLEENLRRAMMFSRGNPATFVSSPLSATLLFIALVVLTLMVLPSIRRQRKKVFTE
jgi:TctA family transporter